MLNKKPIFINNQNTDFSLKRKSIVSSYDNLNRTRAYVRKTNVQGEYTDLSSFLNGDYLDPYFKNPGTRTEDCEKLSNTLYATNRIYQNVLDYLCNMYYWRYVSTPRRVRGKDTAMVVEDYKKIYNKMIEVVDGLNIEVTFPKLLLSIFKNGKVYLYTRQDNSSKSIATILLPDSYCRPTIMTQYGTTQIEFNFKFFDQFSGKDKDVIFDLFPEEFKELYAESKGTWCPLDPKYSTCISMNDAGFPTFLSIFYDIIDYKNYKLNELDRNTNGLERIVAQEIDLAAANMELPELADLHDDMSSVINNNGTTLVTSPGKIHVEQLQDERSTENKVLENAYTSIFDNAGFNNGLFVGESVEALKMSIYRDMRFVWSYVEQLVNFYNLALNNLYSFGSYQLSFKVLPLSPYNEADKLETYRNNASLGVGIVDFMVATGIKQTDIESTLELEEFLDLRNRLLPLQSSYTQSSSTTSNKDEKESADKNSSDENESGSSEESKKTDEK